MNIGGYDHVGVVGGVDYTGSEFILNGDNTGAGTGYGIYALFDQNHKYTITVSAKATSTTMRLFGVASYVRGGIPNSCSPGPANTVLQSSDQYTTIGNISQSYYGYNVLNNYIPSSTGVNYLLFSAYNTVGSIGNVQLESVQITSTLLNCPAPAITNVTGAAASPNYNFTVTFTPPTASAPVNNYDLFVDKFIRFWNGTSYSLAPAGTFATYTNVQSPYTFSMSISDYTASNTYYSVKVGSKCNGEYVYSNSRSIK